MKFEDITNVLCISCVLMFFCVSYQSSCNHEWFGYNCQYICRCENNTRCDVNGSCLQPYTCQAGWFGPACQYADLAYGKGNVAELTDDNDTTCNGPNAGDRVQILFNELNEFTWLRIHVTDQGSDALRDLTVTFNSNTSSVTCPVWKKHAVKKTILDMHCELSERMNEMTLAGPAVPHLCSVYVSAGRNVAVREFAWQGSDYVDNIGGNTVQYDAGRAVDGDTHQGLHDLSCSSTLNTTTWIVHLSRQHSVHRYIIYNRDVVMYRLQGFQLESFDALNHSVFIYFEAAAQPMLTYTITHSPVPVQMVVVTANVSRSMLTLCEVEIYGDSICEPHHYGRDCEHSCSCVDNETCFVSTGACPSGCPPGFGGDSCMDSCPTGKLGRYCNLTCSPNCQPFQDRNTSACDRNAVCQTHCKAGFFGPLCDKLSGCSVGTFGMNCNESCSPNCVPSEQSDVSSCDTKTGACLRGCQSGFSGDLCKEYVAKAADEDFLMEILLGAVLILVLVFLVILCVGKKISKPVAEKTALNAQHGDANATK